MAGKNTAPEGGVTDSPQTTGGGLLPLAGVRVLDFSHILAGPYCTRLLADLGADVVKVESATRPDLTGSLKPTEKSKGRQDRPPIYLNTNRSKRSLTLNLKHPEGLRVATELAAVADVVVENFSAGVMQRLGLDYERLHASNPKLIYLSLSGYGHSGPRKHWTSMNMNLQAHSGLMLATGEEGDPPVAISNSWNDYVGGIHGCFAVIEALRERRQTGRGALLDISQFECSVSTIGGLLMASAASRKSPPRRGNRCSVHTPQGLYRCAGSDEWCAIVVENDAQWQALVQLIDSPQLRAQAYRTVQGRTPNVDAINAALEAWTQTREITEVLRLLQQAGVPAQRMNRIPEVMSLPEAERVYPTVHAPGDEPRQVTGLPVAWEGLASCLRPAPGLGEHNQTVLHEWLALSSVDINELASAGALE